MAKKLSAGLLMFRTTPAFEVFLVHPGGPFFRNKNEGWWTIPKGLPEPKEELLTTACREFQEETGLEVNPPFIPLGNCLQKGGKEVWAWAFCGNWVPEKGIKSNLFTLEWPPRSGTKQEFPEIDRAAWFSVPLAKKMILQPQLLFIERLQEHLA